MMETTIEVMEKKNGRFIKVYWVLIESGVLSSFEVLLFGLIQGLSKKKHCCYATNEYLAGRLNVSATTVKRSVVKMINLKLLEYMGKNEYQHRVVKINPEWKKLIEHYKNDVLTGSKRPGDIGQKDPEILVKKTRHNIDKSNIDKNNKCILKNTYKGSGEPLSSRPALIRRKIEDVKPLSTPVRKVDRSTYESDLPLPKPIFIPKWVEDIISYWEALGLRKTREGTKTYKDNVRWLRRLLRGTAFVKSPLEQNWGDRKFTTEEIRTAMKLFSLAALDPDYEPSNAQYKARLKSYSIADFIFNAHVENGDKSQFLKNLHDPPKRTSQTVRVKKVPDQYLPVVMPMVDTFKQFYLKQVRGGLRINLTPQDENNFIDGAKQLNNFIARNAGKLHNVRDDRQMARFVCEAIWGWAREDGMKITSAKFRSEHTYRDLLPGYLQNIGVVYSEEE